MKRSKVPALVVLLVGICGVVFGSLLAISPFVVDRVRLIEETAPYTGSEPSQLELVLIDKFPGLLAFAIFAISVVPSSALVITGVVLLRKELRADGDELERDLAERQARQLAFKEHQARLTEVLLAEGLPAGGAGPELRRLQETGTEEFSAGFPSERLAHFRRGLGLEPPVTNPLGDTANPDDPSPAAGAAYRPIAVVLFAIGGFLVLWSGLMVLTAFNSNPLAHLGLTVTPADMAIPALLVLATGLIAAMAGAGALQLRKHDERLTGRREAALSALRAERLAATRRRLDRLASAEMPGGMRSVDLEHRLLRAHVLDALSGQDAGRKRETVLHLQESGLLNGGNATDLSGADLRDADLHELDLRGARLAGANLRRADLQQARIDGVDLSRSDLCWADLRDASIAGARLHQANLYGARLHGADLRRADLTSSNLEAANLWQADLGGADLRHARVSAEQIEAARSTAAAVLDSPASEAAAAAAGPVP